MKAVPLFDACHTHFWAVDGSALTVVTDADMPLGRVRENMRNDLAAQRCNEVALPCVHSSKSFLGQTGTHVHGRGWKLHSPDPSGHFGLWGGADYASNADWTEDEKSV